MIGDKYDRFAGKRLHPDSDYKDLGLGTETSMCMMCGEVFSNTRNFDRHRTTEKQKAAQREANPEAKVSVCQHPTAVGLEFRKGVWKMPFNPNASFIRGETKDTMETV